MQVVSPLYVLHHLPQDVQRYIRQFLLHPVSQSRTDRATMIYQGLASLAIKTMTELLVFHPVKDKGVFCADAMYEIKAYLDKHQHDPSHLFQACRFYKTHRIMFYGRSIHRFYFPFSLQERLRQRAG
mgnify:CR=1 FL=1